MSKPKVKVSQKAAPSTQPKAFQNDSASTFSEDEIRTRAYYIYESLTEPTTIPTRIGFRQKQN